MKQLYHFVRFLAIVVVILGLAAPAAAKGTTVGFQTAFDLYRGSEGAFSGWTLSGVALDGGALVLEAASAAVETDPYAPGAYYTGNYYNGGSYFVGEALGPLVTTDFAYTEALASWVASTPPGSWVEILIRADMSGRMSKWYNLGIWASTTETIQRHSVRLQGDGDGYVATDTLVIASKKVAATGYQLKVRLFSADGAAVPVIQNLSVTYSNTLPKKFNVSAGDPALWNTLLTVPECSQMVYPDGGNVWCSPTSTSMVLGYWGTDPGPCEQRVRRAVEGVYDFVYDGHGNWPFNTAYAASRGYEGYVARFTSFGQLEPWVNSEVPVVLSIAWGKGDLTGAPIPSSSGHLVVLVGFDASGNPIINDPAAASDEDVQRTYLRSELEPLWLGNSAGTVYLIFPVGHITPPLN